jgi:hypothetical protein
LYHDYRIEKCRQISIQIKRQGGKPSGNRKVQGVEEEREEVM